jgi:hypothetical protein
MGDEDVQRPADIHGFSHTLCFCNRMIAPPRRKAAARMDRTGLMKASLLVLLLVVGMTLFGAPTAQAQGRLVDNSVSDTNGEPTDPEGALVILEASEYDGDFDTTIPHDEAEAASWFEALLDLLRQLGLLGEVDGENGS